MDREEFNVNEKKKIQSLQGLRAIAFFGVFTLHTYLTYLGSWGVSVFVILSGFLMTYSYFDKELVVSVKGCIEFSVNKIKKLYLLHLVMVAAAIVYPLHFLLENFSIRRIVLDTVKLVLNIALLQDWVPDTNVYYSLNAVSWYLSLSLFLYLAFPLVINILRKIKSLFWIGCIACIIYILQCCVGFSLVYVYIPFIDDVPRWVTYILPIFRLGDFIIGCCAGYIFVNSRKKLGIIWVSICEIIVCVAIYVCQYIYTNQIGFIGSDYFKYNMLFAPTSVCLVYLIALEKGVISKVLSSRTLVYIGNLSPYLFLIHQVVIRYMDSIWNRLSEKPMNVWIKTIGALALSICLAEMYIRAERWFLTKKNIYNKI